MHALVQIGSCFWCYENEICSHLISCYTFWDKFFSSPETDHKHTVTVESSEVTVSWTCRSQNLKRCSGGNSCSGTTKGSGIGSSGRTRQRSFGAPYVLETLKQFCMKKYQSASITLSEEHGIYLSKVSVTETTQNCLNPNTWSTFTKAKATKGNRDVPETVQCEPCESHWPKNETIR